MALFQQYIDKNGHPYLVVDYDDPTHFVNASSNLDIHPFLTDTYIVKRLTSSPFQTDLTENRDDVIIAFLSLFLILIIEASASAFLLRTNKGRVGVFGFSVKYVIELIQDFNMHRLFQRKTNSQRHLKLNARLLIFALSILSLVFFVEVAIIFLTNPELRSVSNDKVSFRILQPVMISPNQVYFHVRTSANRPCESATLVGVHQGATRINTCVTMETANRTIEFIDVEYSKSVTVEITTDIHDYGAEHELRIGDLSAKYSARAYFTLHDGKMRLMKSISQSKHEKKQVEAVHKQFVGAMFSAVIRAKNDKNGADFLDQVNRINCSSTEMEGRDIEVLQSEQKSHTVKTRRYNSTMKGVMPSGLYAIQMAHNVFKGSSAVVLHGGDTQDLFLKEGLQSQKSVVWGEPVRKLNWLSLLIVCLACLFLQIPLHFLLKPISTAYIAGLWAKHKVGAEMERSPIEVSRNERKRFRLYPERNNNGYLYRAESKGMGIDLPEHY
ncbi:unnamed protein product [Chondrus crispus]|uniref:Uncharacterized protein n=1 Tax=Chondrus crispus TaxID=2769 RepID=R7QE76_CHOCR|nr:unnamed protein product [Chondrus crispus]CDF35735.1 unnamed protein product [Chondrus crispus]|eukprot:XP_005715554.1 unnamed protein product [Chondrus crispus]